MPLAARVNDMTSHGAPLGPGPGSSNVTIGNQKAWRALPAGSVGAAVESAAGAVKSLMSSPSLTPASAAPMLAQANMTLQQAATEATAQTNMAAAITTTTALINLNAQSAALAATWTTASAVPGGMAPATAAYTEGLKAAMSTAAAEAFKSIAGSADIHNCPVPCPSPPHGPGVVTRGSKTVRINGLPAARMDDKVFEACGGADAIAIGCPTVNIGDAGGGGGGIGGAAGGSGAAGSDNAADEEPRPADTGRQAANQAAAALIQYQNRAAAIAGRALCEVCDESTRTVGDAGPVSEVA